MFTTSLRETLIVIGLTLLLMLSIGSVVKAAPPAAPVLQVDDEDVGALIVSVRANSPADKAGLVRGDIVLAVDDEPVDGGEALAAAILAHETGDEVVLTVLHGSETVELPVILGERNGRTYLGVQPYVGAPDASTGDVDADEADNENADNDADMADNEGTVEEETLADEDMADEDMADEDMAIEDMAIEEMLKGMFSMDDFGAVIAEVVEDGPAAEAGLASGDVILSVNGEQISPEADLADLIGAFEPGDQVTLGVRNAEVAEGETVEVVVTLGAHPGDANKAFLGVSYMPAPMMFDGLGQLPFGGRMPFSPPDAAPEQDEGAGDEADGDEADGDEADGDEAQEDEAIEDRLKQIFPVDEFGAIVTEVVEDGPAATAGLAKGDVILAVDGERISPEADLAALVGAFEPGDEVTLEVRNADEGEAVEVVVTLGSHPEDEEKAFLGISYMPAPMMFGGPGQMPFRHHMPFSPRGVDPAPEHDDDDSYRHRYHRGHTDGECEHEHEERHPHHGFDRSHSFHGMMPFFDFGMEGHHFEGFDLDQLSEKERKMLQEMMPFLFPSMEAEPESQGGA